MNAFSMVSKIEAEHRNNELAMRLTRIDALADKANRHPRQELQ